MEYVVFGVLYAVSIVLVYFFTKKKYSTVRLSKVNELLSEILEINFRNDSLSNAAQSILVVLRQFYNIDSITIFIRNSDSGRLETIASNVDRAYLSDLENYCNDITEGLITSKTSAKVQTAQGGTLIYPTAEERGIAFSNFTLLSNEDRIIGAILLENRESELFDNNETRHQLYDKIYKSTALVLQNVIYTENLVKMTSTDQLTGVYNRRFIDMTLREQLNVHRNLGLSFSVVLFDIDFFKKFNDTYGHAFGDLVLKEVSAYVKRSLGDNSWIARYGGEEFLIFFGRSQESKVYAKVESIREGLSRLQLTDGETTASVTASFGIATFPSFDGSANDLIQKADEALYQSKRDGRNRTTIARP